MSLPLTLAVLDGMVVTVADHTLVIPLTAIVEILLPKTTEVHGFGGAARVIRVRNGFIPLVDVGEVMGVPRSPSTTRAPAWRCWSKSEGRRAIGPAGRRHPGPGARS